MVLTRLGNKRRIAKDIIPHFPKHTTFVDMFFGAGGMFFSKPRAKYNFCNDLDDDIFNLYIILQSSCDELLEAIEIMPITESLLKYWKKNKETEPIQKAIRFLLLSNFTYLGKGDTLHFSQSNPKESIFKAISIFMKDISRVRFMCEDFRVVLKKLSLKKDGKGVFIYADPPYLGTGSTYSNFKEKDTEDLFKILTSSNMNFAVSEFDHPFVIEQAKKYNLEIITIGERKNIKNKRTEILVVNYESPALYGLFGSHNLAAV